MCTRSAASSFPARRSRRPRKSCEKIAGFWPDIEKSRAEAKRLLKEAGAEGLSFELLNRNVDQPYKYVGTWLVDQWSKIGLHVNQRVVPTGPWFARERSGDFTVVLEANCHSVVNPLLDVQPFLPQLGQRAKLRKLRRPESEDDSTRRCCTRPIRGSSARMHEFEKHVMDDRRIS